ncbi:phage/plasmid primase, P4 family [Paenibacillus sp. MY03]|uniref:DNA primase family protein n=1 Tax=Paenibacillus sp. MY03 TaxID=302980 RepID=UPI0015C68AAD|nr:phage/plasmid primase, P4 family [Paenibacillus sp. MY03]
MNDIYDVFENAKRRLEHTEAREIFVKHLKESKEPEVYGNFEIENFADNIQDAQTVTECEDQTKTNQSKGNKIPIAFDVTQTFLSHFVVICVGGRVLLYDDNYGYFREDSELELAVRIRNCISQHQNMHLDRARMVDVLHRLKSEPSIQVESSRLDSYTRVINFRNGVYDLSEDRLEPHSSKKFFTSFIDADYDSLPYNDIGNSRFHEFLLDCTDGDSEKINTLQEVTGYIICNEWRAKKFFALIGLPHTGKSVWLEIWKSLIGAQFTTAVSLNQLGSNRFMTAELSRSKLNISAELDEKGMLKGVDLIKMITGGDMMTAERKGQDPFHFYPKSKLVVAGNRMPLPEGSDMTDAFLDRIHFLTFVYQVPEDKRDKGLIPKLLMEKDIIAAWAIEGLQRLHSNNYVFTECKDAIAFRKAYRNEKNSAQAFINDACIVNKADVNLREHRRTLLKAYKEYCKSNCLRAMSDGDFFNQLINLGLDQKKFRLNGNPLRGFFGISLVSKDDNVDMESHFEQLSSSVRVYAPGSTVATEINNPRK